MFALLGGVRCPPRRRLRCGDKKIPSRPAARLRNAQNLQPIWQTTTTFSLPSVPVFNPTLAALNRDWLISRLSSKVICISFPHNAAIASNCSLKSLFFCGRQRRTSCCTDMHFWCNQKFFNQCSTSIAFCYWCWDSSRDQRVMFWNILGTKSVWIFWFGNCSFQMNF